MASNDQKNKMAPAIKESFRVVSAADTTVSVKIDSKQERLLPDRAV